VSYDVASTLIPSLLTGYLLQKTDNWEISMFLPAICFYFAGAAVFAKFGSAEKQSWG